MSGMSNDLKKLIMETHMCVQYCHQLVKVRIVL